MSENGFEWCPSPFYHVLCSPTPLYGRQGDQKKSHFFDHSPLFISLTANELPPPFGVLLVTEHRSKRTLLFYIQSIASPAAIIAIRLGEHGEPLFLRRTIHGVGNVIPVAPCSSSTAFHAIYIPQSTVVKHARDEVIAPFRIYHRRQVVNIAIIVELEGNELRHRTPT